MNYEFFIAKRLYKNEQGAQRVSRPAVLIAQIGVTLGLVVMLVTIAVSFGFKNEVRDKAIGFGSHLHVNNYNSSHSYEPEYITADSSLMDMMHAMEGVAQVQRYATKPGVFRTDEDFLGFVLKGVGQEYDLSFYNQYLTEGEVPMFTDSTSSNRLLISRVMADVLGLSVGDKIDSYFLQGSVRARRFVVAGIYETGFSDYDRMFAIADMHTVQVLNRWQQSEVSGVEIMLTDYRQLESVSWDLSTRLEDEFDKRGEPYFVQTVEEMNAGLFAWLDVLDMNVWLILVLVIGVAGFTMISGLLILILERTQFIGILKALGASNISVRKVFLYLAMFIVCKGMLWGNVIGLGLCALQKFTRLVPLDPANYYLDCVPIAFDWGFFLLINVVMFVLSVLMLLLPSHLISHIYPTKAMRFE